MYILKRSIPDIINLNDINLIPRVVNKKTIVDQFGNRNEIFTLEFYCQVDLEKIRSLKRKIRRGMSIDFRISKYNLGYYRNLANKSATSVEVSKSRVKLDATDDTSNRKKKKRTRRNRRNRTGARGKKSGTRRNIRRTNNKHRKSATSKRRRSSLSLRQLKRSIMKASGFRHVKNKNIYRRAPKLGNLGLNNRIISSSARETIVEVKERRHKNILPPGTASGVKFNDNLVGNYSNMFQNTYLSMIEKNEDPAVLFENSFEKRSFKEIRKGMIPHSKVKNKTHHNAFVPLYQNITFNISSASSKKYDIVQKTQRKKFLKVSMRTTISATNLKSYGSSFYVLLLLKGKKGNYLETKSYRVDMDDIIDQLKINSTTFDLSTTRNKNNASILKIGNSNLKKPADIVVEAKSIQRSFPNSSAYYSGYSRKIINPNGRTKIVDGNAQRRSKPSIFHPSDTIFYRGLLNFKNKKYYNCKSIVDKSKKKQENIPFCTIIAKSSMTTRSGVEIKIDNISNNVVSVRPKKYLYKGETRVKSDLKNVDVDINQPALFQKISKTGTTASFFDINVRDKQTYMYVVECKMQNGEIKMAKSYFIHHFEKRTNTVIIQDFRAIAPQISPDNDDHHTIKLENIKRKINISFKVIKIQNEMDKILENMFGNLYDLFEDKLKKIRDVQSLVYSIEVMRVNYQTGEKVTIGKVSPDENGDCALIDHDAPLVSDCFYVLNPRVRLATEAIEDIHSQIDIMATRYKRRPISYGAARRNRNNRYRRKKGRHSAVGGKYGRRRAFTRSILETEKYVIGRQNLDIFLDSTTGDIFNSDEIEGININRYSGDSLIVRNGDVDEIHHDVNNLNVLAKNTLDDELFDLSFNVVYDMHVDFYAIFIKEGRKAYLDGTMHSTDTLAINKRYSYLVSHKGSIGLIEYYIVPFYKNGLVGSPKLITAQILR